jgi:putative transcriptional regulator
MQSGAGPGTGHGSSPTLRPGVLLVAAPVLVDSSFARSVVLLLDVDANGVLGVVLNRPSDLPVAEVLGPWRDVVSAPGVLFQGGPVGAGEALGVAVLSGRDSSEAQQPVGWRPLFASTGLVDLDAPRELVGPALLGLRIYAGYAGWSAGQLEAEIEEGAWFVVPGEEQDGLCADPEQLRTRVLRRQPGPLAWLATYPEDPTQN